MNSKFFAFLTSLVLSASTAFSQQIFVSDQAKDDLWQDVQSVPRVEVGEDYEQQNLKRYAKLVTLVDGLGNKIERIDHSVLRLGVDQEQSIQNVVFKLGSGTRPTIVIGAHLDKVAEAGSGIIDDWTGCVNIIHTAKALLGQENLKHNFVFVCFAYEERQPEGLWGSRTFVNDLRLGRHQELQELVGGLHNIKAMVNFECLGVSELYGWKEGSTDWLAELASGVADELPDTSFTNRSIGLPVGADSVPFFYAGVPCITIDSLRAPDDFSKIHSERDSLENVSETKLGNTLQFSISYLVALDGFLSTPFAQRRFASSFLSPPNPVSYPNVVFESFGHTFLKKQNGHSAFHSPVIANTAIKSRNSASKLAVQFEGAIFVIWINEEGQIKK